MEALQEQRPRECMHVFRILGIKHYCLQEHHLLPFHAAVVDLASRVIGPQGLRLAFVADGDDAMVVDAEIHVAVEYVYSTLMHPFGHFAKRWKVFSGTLLGDSYMDICR